MSERPLKYPDEIDSAPGCTHEEIEREVELEEARTRYSRAFGSGSSACEEKVYFDTHPRCWAHNEECMDRWNCPNGWIHTCTNDSGDNSLDLCAMHYHQIVGR